MTTPLAPAPTAADYADRLQLLLNRVIGAVHDEGPEAVQVAVDLAMAEPAPPGVDPVTAAITILAAQVDPEASTYTRLGWIDRGLRRLRRTPEDEDCTRDALDGQMARVIQDLADEAERSQRLYDPRVGHMAVDVIRRRQRFLDLHLDHQIAIVGLLCDHLRVTGTTAGPLLGTSGKTALDRLAAYRKEEARSAERSAAVA